MKVISVELNGIDELFQEPEFDPFDPTRRCESGMADLFNQTQDLSSKEHLQIVISLPEDAAEPEMENKIISAIKRYCEIKIVQSDREIREIRKQGMRDLRWAMVISVILLLGAYLITQLTILPEILIYMLIHWRWNHRLGDALATPGQPPLRMESLPPNEITLSAAEISPGNP